MKIVQLGLFDIHEALPDHVFSNQELYRSVSDMYSVSDEQSEQVKGGIKTWKRSIRYALQSLKIKGLVQRVGHDAWERTGTRKEFTTLIGSQCVLAYSTSLGVAVWADAKAAAAAIDEPVHVMLSSPPYPLTVQRNYGQGPKDEQAYVDWLCSALEPLIDKLAPGGSIVLNLGNDIFQSKSPARSTYKESLTLALKNRFCLEFMDSIIWVSNKSPSPIQWAQREAIQLFSGYENLLWFTNDPGLCQSDNSRILHRTKGLPRNVWDISNTCSSGRQLHKMADQVGLPRHQALMPLELAKTAIEFWTSPGQLVVDLFSGGNTIGLAAEKLNRRWFASDIHLEMLKLSQLRFAQ